MAGSRAATVETQREAGKAARRGRILSAAEALLEEVGEAGFSMRELAQRSGVSPATPYNLFGSKHGVLLGIYNDDLQHFRESFSAISSANEIERFFDFIHAARSTFEQRPQFYRVIMRSISTHAPPDLRTGLMKPREEIYATLTREAIMRGCIVPEVDSSAFARTVAYIMGGALESWIADEITLREFEDCACYGVALLLLGICTSDFREPLLLKVSQHGRTQPQDGHWSEKSRLLG